MGLKFLYYTCVRNKVFSIKKYEWEKVSILNFSLAALHHPLHQGDEKCLLGLDSGNTTDHQG